MSCQVRKKKKTSLKVSAAFLCSKVFCKLPFVFWKKTNLRIIRDVSCVFLFGNRVCGVCVCVVCGVCVCVCVYSNSIVATRGREEVQVTAGEFPLPQYVERRFNINFRSQKPRTTKGDVSPRDCSAAFACSVL